MEIKMLKSTLGSDRTEDGIAMPIQRYVGGEVYTVGDELGRVLIQTGAAEYAGALTDESLSDVKTPSTETVKDAAVKLAKKIKKKMHLGAPENKGSK